MVLWLILFSEFFSHRIDLQEGRRIIYPSLHLFYIVEMISIVCEFVNKDSLFTNGDYDSLRANPLGTSKTGFGQVKIMKKFVWIIRPCTGCVLPYTSTILQPPKYSENNDVSIVSDISITRNWG
jgi:hypothetical protein